MEGVYTDNRQEEGKAKAGGEEMGRQVPELINIHYVFTAAATILSVDLMTGVNPFRYSFLGLDVFCITNYWKRFGNEQSRIFSYVTI